MFTGSMMGSGSAHFAVWTYVISHMMPDTSVGMQVELNPKLMAVLIGEDENVIIKVIERFCAPDPRSRSKENDGRKLIRLGEFDYQVVNGRKYRDIKDQEDRRRANREAQARWRQNHAKPKKAKRGGPSAREREFERTGDDRLCDRPGNEPYQANGS